MIIFGFMAQAPTFARSSGDQFKKYRVFTSASLAPDRIAAAA
jgi:hypothetical protein